jgi:hypothetical protein
MGTGEGPLGIVAKRKYIASLMTGAVNEAF